MHHPSCPARTGTGPCICPPGKGPQIIPPKKPATKPKVTPRPKKGK